ncbi:DUF1513 domain-containing protein [Dinoroseobacter sp. PD6]|uniref:DUF1513 domain-containing protein n=1 Tax=Dinoroseobacter sp. PD6 TaxID=3028384 RepID=UPI00237A3B09|nr:DUF1513 domain-containing protein [Dinoroseobacter sp. PD6]MDD9717516.1 DUF1513 domain-containing protein [Dinoroseobacter sp. PD6]
MASGLSGRRAFLGGLLSAGLTPALTWADAGSPAYLSAAVTSDGRYVLCGIDAALRIRFEVPLPARGHAAAAHPSRPEAVAFARRPGRFALVLDCVSGAQKAMLQTPEGRHFYGHGTFSADGSLLYTTENDYEAGRGRVGLWDVTRGYIRLGEWDSGGIGPHDIERLPGTDTLVVANGGIDTHPDSGRAKLNIPTMRPNLAYLDQGRIIEIAELPPELHRNSIRHLAVAPDGAVAFGMQRQGDGPVAALAGLHRRGSEPRLVHAPAPEMRALAGYVGSIAISRDGATIAVTSPRGNTLQCHDARSLTFLEAYELTDVCGVVKAGTGFLATSGAGQLVALANRAPVRTAQTALRWDNHLISV